MSYRSDMSAPAILNVMSCENYHRAFQYCQRQRGQGLCIRSLIPRKVPMVALVWSNRDHGGDENVRSWLLHPYWISRGWDWSWVETLSVDQIDDFSPKENHHSGRDRDHSSRRISTEVIWIFWVKSTLGRWLTSLKTIWEKLPLIMMWLNRSMTAEQLRQ